MGAPRKLTTMPGCIETVDCCYSCHYVHVVPGGYETTAAAYCTYQEKFEVIAVLKRIEDTEHFYSESDSSEEDALFDRAHELWVPFTGKCACFIRKKGAM